MNVVKRIAHWVFHEVESPCLNCASSCYTRAASLIGITPMKITCTHEEYVKSSFEKSIICKSVSYALGFVFLVGTWFEFNGAYDKEKSFWDLGNMTVLGKLVLGLNSGFMVLWFNYRSDIMFTMLENYATIMPHVDKNRLVQAMGHTRIKSFVYVLVSLIVAVLSGIFDYAHTKSPTCLFTFLKLYVHSMFALGVAILADIYVYCVGIGYENIKTFLEFIVEVRRLHPIDESASLQHDFHKLVDCKFLLHLSTITVNMYITPGVTVYLVMIILIHYIGFYQGIIFIINLDSSDQNSSQSLVFLLGGITVIYCCLRAQDVFDFNEDFIHYLYSFPIMKLPVKYRYKVETLLMTLKNQYFEIRASSIVTLSRRFVAAAFYVVLTYVLVGLQFYYQDKVKENRL